MHLAFDCRNVAHYSSPSSLDAHLAARHDVGDDVLWRRVGVDAVRPLVDGDHVAALLVRVGRLARLVDEGAPRQASHLRKRKERAMLQCFPDIVILSGNGKGVAETVRYRYSVIAQQVQYREEHLLG